jgi:hypothetical protein
VLEVKTIIKHGNFVNRLSKPKGGQDYLFKVENGK